MSQPIRVCELPAKTGTRFGQIATGTEAGYWRHLKADEPICDECLEARNEARRKRYAENPEPRLESAKKWVESNPDQRREVVQAWVRANRERKRASDRQWRKDYPEKHRETQRRRRTTKRSGLTIPFTDEQLRARLSMFPGCWMCGQDADVVDHVKPLSKGGAHILANLRPACQLCNSSKGGKWPFVVE